MHSYITCWVIFCTIITYFSCFTTLLKWELGVDDLDIKVKGSRIDYKMFDDLHTNNQT